MGRWPVVVAFTLTYLCPFVMHALRESWAMVTSTQSKPDVHRDLGFSGAVLGGFDFCFFFFYSVGLYVAGALGDRFSIKLLLFAGLLVSAGVLTAVTTTQISGMGRAQYRQPELYFILFSVFGLTLSTVWPGTVAVIGGWFPAHNRGRVFGIWSSNLAVGNAAGAQLSNLVQNGLHQDWTVLLWLVCALTALIALLVLLFLKEKPPNEGEKERSFSVAFSIQEYEVVSQKRGVSFCEALLMPGVVLYSVVYALVKLVHTTFVVWLPFYISDVLRQEHNKGNLAALYDVGTIVGSYGVGYISDYMRMRSPTVMVMIAAAIPCIYVFGAISDTVLWPFFLIVPALGFEIGGTSGLISSAIAADIAKDDSRGDKSEAMSTVAGIVDGTGSLGTAIGQLVVGWLLEKSWSYVFDFLMCCCFLAGVLMSPLLRKELRRRNDRKESIAPMFNEGL